jgi:hypothetical protein
MQNMTFHQSTQICRQISLTLPKMSSWQRAFHESIPLISRSSIQDTQCTNDFAESFSFLRCGDFVASANLSQLQVAQISLTPLQSTHFVAGMVVAKRDGGFDNFERKTSFMKTLVSFVLGAALLFGAATFGSPSGSASARDRHDKNWHNHQHRHHRHHRHRRGHKLSY